MRKLFQELEQIFRFRILSNDDIPAYMKRMSSIGKIDDVRRHEVEILILKKLAELEDREPIVRQEVVQEESLTCEECGFTAKSRIGLLSHSSKHKKVV